MSRIVWGDTGTATETEGREGRGPVGKTASLSYKAVPVLDSGFSVAKVSIYYHLVCSLIELILLAVFVSVYLITCKRSCYIQVVSTKLERSLATG